MTKLIDEEDKILKEQQEIREKECKNFEYVKDEIKEITKRMRIQINEKKVKFLKGDNFRIRIPMVDQ
jgi:hypothetical protein